MEYVVHTYSINNRKIVAKSTYFLRILHKYEKSKQ